MVESLSRECDQPRQSIAAVHDAYEEIIPPPGRVRSQLVHVVVVGPDMDLPGIFHSSWQNSKQDICNLSNRFTTAAAPD